LTGVAGAGTVGLAMPNSLKQTPLRAAHVALGAKMVPFDGWDMTAEYTGTIDEHCAEVGT